MKQTKNHSNHEVKKVELPVEEAKQIYKIIEEFAPIYCWAKCEKAIENLARQIEQKEAEK